MDRLIRLNEVQYAESDFQREKLISEGFVLDGAEPHNNDIPHNDDIPLDKMTKQQLVEYAEANGIDISGVDTKGDILSLLQG